MFVVRYLLLLLLLLKAKANVAIETTYKTIVSYIGYIYIQDIVRCDCK